MFWQATISKSQKMTMWLHLRKANLGQPLNSKTNYWFSLISLKVAVDITEYLKPHAFYDRLIFFSPHSLLWPWIKSKSIWNIPPPPPLYPQHLSLSLPSISTLSQPTSLFPTLDQNSLSLSDRKIQQLFDNRKPYMNGMSHWLYLSIYFGGGLRNLYKLIFYWSG